MRSRFAKVVDPLLSAKSWTHSDLAAAIDVSDAAVSRWFSGLRTPGYAQIPAIAAALGVPLTQLTRELGIEHPIEPVTYAKLEANLRKILGRAEDAEGALVRAKLEREALEETVRLLHLQIADLSTQLDVVRAKLAAEQQASSSETLVPLKEHERESRRRYCERALVRMNHRRKATADALGITTETLRQILSC